MPAPYHCQAVGRGVPVSRDRRNYMKCLLSDETTAEYTERYYRELDRAVKGVTEKMRYEALSSSGGKCDLCGSSDSLQVDHIIPVSIRPDLVRSFDNLQVLCFRCNIGKSNNCDIDWRKDNT